VIKKKLLFGFIFNKLILSSENVADIFEPNKKQQIADLFYIGILRKACCVTINFK
jgi:hypothetical protein